MLSERAKNHSPVQLSNLALKMISITKETTYQLFNIGILRDGLKGTQATIFHKIDMLVVE